MVADIRILCKYKDNTVNWMTEKTGENEEVYDI